MTTRPKLLFVSPRFLFPADCGGKIRSSQVLAGLKGGHFDVTLASPAPAGAATDHADELARCCDRFVSWPEQPRGRFFNVTRLRHLLAELPVPVATDRSARGTATIEALLAKAPDVVVVDFPHAAVLMPSRMACATVMFTHNIEAEIFRRHVEVAASPLQRAVWQNQADEMLRFERRTLRGYDRVVAVSERDATFFRSEFDIDSVRVIPTGVDLDKFEFAGPDGKPTVVFLGSMDWLANVDGVQFFMDEVWPRVVDACPSAQMRVVGRAPPPALVETAAQRGLNWQFTGFVDDVRPHVHGAAAFVIPLRVGGGTRIKAYEAMAMGCPVVSTSIGVEGLPVVDGEHFLKADDAESMAAAVCRLIHSQDLGHQLATQARQYVEHNFGARVVAGVFESICIDAVDAAAATARANGPTGTRAATGA